MYLDGCSPGMDFLNKLSSTVSSTVSQLSGVLPGNPVTREFEATTHIASAGPGLLWKVYRGYKKSTKQDASIFVFEKRQLERWPRGDRDTILDSLRRAFATEPVFASLANILGWTENVPTPLPTQLHNFKLFEVEIKYGLLQVGEGLVFLHNDVKLLHRNICPEVVLVNLQGAWKIFGFDFCQHSNCVDDMQLKSLPLTKLQGVAQGLREYVKMMLNVTPELRPDAHQFIKIDFFEDVGVKTLNYLDSLFQWDNLQKSQFYKGLPQILQNLPHREFVNPTMVPFVLPNILLISDSCTKEEFSFHVLPHLKTILLIFMQKMELLLKLTPAAEIKTDVLPMLYRALESDAQQIQELCLSVLPTFAGLIDYPAMKNALLPRIKKLCVNTSYISVWITALALANTRQLCVFFVQVRCLAGTNDVCDPQVRVNCLVCVGKLLEHLDKWLVLDEVLPFLPQIPSREPAVLMGILGIYKLSLTDKKLGITKEVMATKILPFLMPLSIENGLTLNQFNALISLIKEMVSRVEGEHRTKLEQLNSIQAESKYVYWSDFTSWGASDQVGTAQLHTGGEQSSQDLNTVSSSSEVQSQCEKDTLDHEATGTSSEVIDYRIFRSVQLGPSLLLVGAPVPQTELEQMFSGLGLDTYMGGNAATPTPVVNTTNSTASSLSLQDKQRLARQQEALASPPAQPMVSQPAPRLPRPPAPKDLTASLIDTNLTQMRLTRPPTYNWPSPSPASVRPAFNTQGFQGTSPSPWRSTSPLNSLPLSLTPTPPNLPLLRPPSKTLTASEINDLLG
uniref:SCY1-like protein 2 n=1 Tax=Timema shepardi TaxID=629360 RepID=A0A7R9G485_TIMSH|nr:unnamed protein product [Timema shepardi]